MKQYKHNTPEETIFNIRRILNDLDILLLERHFITSNRYSCRVIIGNHGLSDLNIGTNGKGRTFEYSLASGYAEFAERLQNRLLLDGHRMVTEKTFNQFSFASDAGGQLSYTFDPQERLINPNNFSPTVKKEILKLCHLAETADISDVFPEANDGRDEICIPFYDVQMQAEEWFPVNFVLRITGSNGMASGNTPKEAILQALCEVFERYVIREIYYKSITPPDIPMEEFQGTDIYNRLVEYKQATGHQLLIKDCSLGQGLPALGLAIIDRETMSYNFKIGVDFVPDIALERCFTETFQGRNKLEGLPYTFTDFNNAELNDSDALENNLMKIFVNGTGFWPKSVLCGEPSYTFTGFDQSYGQSNKSDIDISLHLLSKLNHSLYIRDNSILGFPAYFVLIPGLSEITERNPLDTSKQFKKSLLKLDDINHLGRINTEMAESILQGINENYDLIKSENFQLKHVLVYNVNEDLSNLEIDMLGALLSYFIDDIDGCIRFLTSYLEGKEKGVFKYYYACLDYLKARKEYGEDGAYKTTSILYGDELAQEIAGDFKDPKSIFQYYHLPNCPFCTDCGLAAECRERAIIDIKNKIKTIEIKNAINQGNIKDYLNNNDD